MILWLYEFRKNEGKREEFKHALVIEEGHHILSQKKEHVEGVETIMETSLRQIREFGEAVIVIDQEPTKLSHSIKANTYSKIIFNLGNGKDVTEISECAGEVFQCVGVLPECVEEMSECAGHVFECVEELPECVGEMSECAVEVFECVREVPECV